MTRDYYDTFRNIALYAVIGGFCATLDFCIYTALCHSGLMPYLWANIVSTNVGIMTSFALNRSLNFRVKDRTPLRFVSFYLVGATGLGVSSLLLYTTVTLAGWDEVPGKLFATVVVALVQFTLNKLITFRK